MGARVGGMRATTWWKLLGMAGMAGVVATGAVVARAERQRMSYTPEQVRDRLHQRHQELEQETPTPG
jgi:hypothetical protein